jgi:hypothetical protein
LVGVAVNVTLFPEHIAEDDAAIATLAAADGLTVIVIAFEVAGEPVTHAPLAVITQVTTLPLVSVLVVNVGLFVPTFVVPTFH